MERSGCGDVVAAGWRSDMKVKRVFWTAVFCCCVSVSRLLQIRSADEPSEIIRFVHPLMVALLSFIVIKVVEDINTDWCVSVVLLLLAQIVELD